MAPPLFADRASLDAYLEARKQQPDEFQRHSVETAEVEANKAEQRLEEAHYCYSSCRIR